MKEIVRKNGAQMVRCNSDLPNFRQLMGEPSPSGTKERWDGGSEERKIMN